MMRKVVPFGEPEKRRLDEFTTRTVAALANARAEGTYTAEASPGLLLRLGSRGAGWTIRVGYEGADLRLPLGPWPDVSIAQALQILDDVRQRARAGLDPRGSRFLVRPATLADLIARWTGEAPKQKWRTKRAQQVRKAVRPLLDTPASLVRADDLRTVLGPVIRNHAATARVVIGDLRSMFRLGMDADVVRDNPASLVRRPPRSIDRNYLDLSDLRTILRASDQLPPLDRAYVRFLILTGCRTGESVKLRSRDIDWTGQRIVVPGRIAKMASENWIALPPQLDAVLRTVLDPERPAPHPIFKAMTKERRARLIEWINQQTRAGSRRGAETWVRLHAFRKTLPTEGQRIGLAGEHLDAVIGHKTITGARQSYDFASRWPERQFVTIAWASALDLLENGGAEMAQKSPIDVVLRKHVQGLERAWKEGGSDPSPGR
jgi:integrase